MLAGSDAAVAQDVGERDERGDRPILGRPEPGDRAAIGRIKLLGVAEPDVVERRNMTGQAVISGRVVVLHPVIDRADLRELVDHRGEPGQMLADRQTRLAGGDRLKLAANAGRRGRLHIERVEVRRPAELMQEDDVLGSSRRARVLFGLEQRGQAQSGDAGGPRLEQAATGDLASRPIIKATGSPCLQLPSSMPAARTLCC